MKTVNQFFNSPGSGGINGGMRRRRGTTSEEDGMSTSSLNLASTRKYFSRKFSSQISWHELPLEKNALGMITPAGIFFLLMRLTVAPVYIYIVLILLRELSLAFPNTLYAFLQSYMSPLAYIIHKMHKSSFFVEIWVVIEAIFYIIQILHIRHLQYKDPLEASLSAAPISTIHERWKLMNQMLSQVSSDDPVAFIRGWFFDKELEEITRYDVLDFCAWSMYEGRHQEHLTRGEVNQLNWFVRELECRIGVFLYGVGVTLESNDSGTDNDHDHDDDLSYDNGEEEEEEEQFPTIIHNDMQVDDHKSPTLRQRNIPKNVTNTFDSGVTFDMDDDHNYYDSKDASPTNKSHMQPKKNFHFTDTTHDTTPSFFTNLFESYNHAHQQYNKRPTPKSVQHIRKFVASKRQQFVEAEEHAIAAASNMYEHAYAKFVHKGSSFDKRINAISNATHQIIHKGSIFDKRINAISNATHQQLNDAWNSVGKMKERLETAKYVSSRKRFLQQQNKGYHLLLERIIHSTSVPVPQLLDLLKKITQCNNELEMVEDSAMDSFLKVTGFARKHLLQQTEPQRYAKYTADQLMGLAVYPLAFNLAILGLTDGLLRIVMAKRGFERLNIGTTVYYFHPGQSRQNEEGDINDYNYFEERDDHSPTPIIFCHGIGVGIGYYMALIDGLLKLGRPLFLPEIPYVCGFRPWIKRKAYLTPPTVVSTLTAMLASHGHMKGSFIGHSYGTSWVSYMCKYASDTVASVMFLDPICFCLHHPCLTKSFVYHRADPGSISYMVKTDIIVNWTIQRAFPWSRIVLFVEDLPNVPCSIYLSEHDTLIPVEIVEKYLRINGAHVCDEAKATPEHFRKGPINVTVLKGDAHGDWPLRSSTSQGIANTARILTEQYESEFSN